ncbi:MAG: radical SAM protein [Desulfuromonas thiophila]|nr:radical SAM protein [Desulfuromonas thiophila]
MNVSQQSADQSPVRLYGPVPSRRLGRSLGVDLVPYKVCSYDCSYCQLGHTTELTAERREYVDAAAVLAQLRQRLEQGLCCDYISLAGSGEPTLNSGLGWLLRQIKALTRLPLAVITNGSLLWRVDVREELLVADLVLPSLDAGDAALFEQVNRPCGAIDFERMAEGLIAFRRQYRGALWLEVLLLDGLSDTPERVAPIAAWVERIRPDRVQLNSAVRPTADAAARPLSPAQLQALAPLFSAPVDILTAPAAAPVSSPDSPAASAAGLSVLALLQRRPCTCADIARGLGLAPQQVIKLLDPLLAAGVLHSCQRDGQTFYQASAAGR